MPLTLEQYADYLDTRGLPWPAPPEVQRRKVKPHLTPLPQVRAVTWNLYGTLLAITSGELVFEHPNQFIMDVALDKTIQEFNMWASMSRKPGQPAEFMRQIYVQVLQEQSAFAGASIKHPEVLSERVWESIIKKLLQKEYRWDTGFFGALNEFAQKVAYFFHASLQGIAAYPGAAWALQHVHESGLIQALLADAQRFTELQLHRGLKAQNAEARPAECLDAAASALSYKVGVRKPEELLFRHTLGVLRERGITPDQVLHIGSRIAQDIVPARRMGMRTALFAGDAASLQATPEQLRGSTTRPDILMTDLEQIADIVPGN